MKRLIFAVEGETEEAIVNNVLSPHLLNHDVYASATRVGKAKAQRRNQSERGGGDYGSWRSDLVAILRGDRSRDLRVTTIFDLYGLPSGFPKLRELRAVQDSTRRCEQLEDALAEDIADARFLPYLQRHETEALVLASLDGLRQHLDAPDDLRAFERLKDTIGGIPPEEVNDDPNTAPSKRLATIPSYRKTLHGPVAVASTNLADIRSRCPRFDAWMSKLEALGEGT